MVATWIANQTNKDTCLAKQAQAVIHAQGDYRLFWDIVFPYILKTNLFGSPILSLLNLKFS